MRSGSRDSARPRRRGPSRCLLGVALVGVTLALAVATSAASAQRVASPAKASGDVDVISAGSLQTLMAKIAPAFQAATGYKLVDTSGGSSPDAADIKNKVDVEDVFVSASPAVDTTLEGKKNGSWVSWYASFAASPEVLGYYPKSKFANGPEDDALVQGDHDARVPPRTDQPVPGSRRGAGRQGARADGDEAASPGAEEACHGILGRILGDHRAGRASRAGSSTHRSCTRPMPTPRRARS